MNQITADILASPAATAGLRPLIVDLDGTLLKTDLLVESFLALLARDPLAALGAVAALRGGRAALKARLADLSVLDLHSMPVDPAVAAVIARHREQGGRVYVASASDVR